MGCLSLTVSPVLPTVVANAETAGGARVGVYIATPRPEARAMSLNGVEAKASKMYSYDVTSCGMNVNLEAAAWLVCQVNTGQMFLAVTEGWLLTIDKGYLRVRRE